MATLVARQKGKSSPQSENRGSSESSKSASSRDNGGGFQRGFLLSSRSSKKATKGSSRGISRGQTLTDPSTITGTKSSVSPSASALQQLVGPTTSAAAAAAANDQKQECSSTKTAKAQTPLVERAAEKNDSGWAKGFLTNESKKEKRTTTATATVSAVGVTQSKGSNARKSKARTSVATPSKKKDLGWSKGFLTNTNINNRKKETKIENETKRNLLDDTNRDSKIERQRKEQTSPKGNYPKAVRRSCSLLSIDDNDNDGDRCSKNAAQIIAPANTSPKTALTTHPGDTKPLISVVFEESSNDTTKSPDSPQQLDQDSTVEINKRRRNSNVEGATTMFATKSLITPLISIVGEEEDGEEKSSSIFFKEVSTTRKSNHGRSEIAELMGVREEERCYSPDEGQSVSMENMKDEKKEELSGATLNNDNDSNSNILKFQQELERLFSRPLKGSDDKDELQTIRMQFKTPEHRRYAWTYVLQQRQQQQVRQKRRIENVRETNECDGRIRELFDAEYFHHRQQQHEITINDYGNNDEAESPLESILRCVETDEERRMSLQAVLLILEYFSFRYKEQEQHPKHKIPLRSSNNSTLANVHAQAERIRRLMPLVVQLTRLSSSDRRTRLVQISWETAILLVSFCIREFLRVVPPSSSLFDNSSSTLSVTFWDQLDLLLHHQLIWQQSKTKSNAVKINHLKEVRTKSIFFLKDRNPQQKERLGVSMESLLELVIDLEKLMNL